VFKWAAFAGAHKQGYSLDTCKSLKPLRSQLNFILHELFECQMQTFVKPDRRLANKRTNKGTYKHKWVGDWGELGWVGCWMDEVLWSLHNLNVACTKLTIFVACQWIFRPFSRTAPHHPTPPTFPLSWRQFKQVGRPSWPNEFSTLSPFRFSGYSPAWSLSLLCFCCKTIRRQLNYLHCLHLSFVAIGVAVAVAFRLLCRCCSRPGSPKVLALRNSFSVWRHKFHG